MEKTNRIHALEKINKNLQGIQIYIKNYNPLFEDYLNRAKHISDNEKYVAFLIQTHVTIIIQTNDEKIKENAREFLDEELEKNNIIQIGKKQLYNFSCLPLKGMIIRGTGNFYDFKYSDLRSVRFEGLDHTDGCLHANYMGADISDSMHVNDFCTKSSTYTCCNMTNAVLSGLNLGACEFAGAITIGTKVRTNHGIIDFSSEDVFKIGEEPLIDNNDSLAQLKEIKDNFRKLSNV